MPERSTVLVCIPVYNHGASLRQVVEGVLEHHPHMLVVDDGSTDGGADTLDGLGVQVVHHSVNQGKGKAILTAIEAAAGMGMSHIITIDADGQHDPGDIPAFLRAIDLDPTAIIVGTRDFTADNVPRSSKFGRAFSNFWLRVQTGVAMGDVQSGFRAYPVTLVQTLSLQETRYAMEAEVLVKASWAGFPLHDIPISVYYPEPDQRISHFRGLQDNIQFSLMNTRLTARSFVPVPHRQYSSDEEGKISPIHPMRSLKILLRQKNTPYQLAMAGALGMLLGTLPLIGLHSIAIIFVAAWFRLSKITALAVSQLCMPPFVPAFCIEVGYYLQHGALLTEISLQTLGYEALDRAVEWGLGSLVLAPALAVIMAGVIFMLALVAQIRLGQGESPASLAEGNNDG